MSSLVKYVKSTYGSKSLGEAIKAGAWKVVLNGNAAESSVLHGGKGSTLVGTDYHGNKYFANPSKQYGRHRWVVYADAAAQDASCIPPEWHTWLCHISDVVPTQEELPKPIFYVKTPAATPTGTRAAYKPKGDWWNPKQRNWQKVQAWQPPQ